MKDYNEQTEKNLIEMIKQKEASDKRLLTMEIVIGLISTLFLFSMIGVGVVFMKMKMDEWVFFLLLGIGLAQFIVAMMFSLRIEQIAGYYECKKCGHRYVPTYKSVNLAPHIGRTRYMKCPKCGKKTWQKKVLTKE